MKTLQTLTALLLCLGGDTYSSPAETFYTPDPVGSKVPNFSLAELVNNKSLITGKGIFGNPFILLFWAEWTPNADDIRLIPTFLDNDIPTLAVAYKISDLDAGLKKLARLGIQYDNPFDSLVLVSDPEGSFGDLVGVHGVPQMYLVDKNRVVQKNWTGAVTKKRWTADMQELVKSLKLK